MTSPLVSAILPVYNGERHLAEALQSVFAQTSFPVEIIVVDDGSTDRSAEIAKSFASVRYISQSNAGVAAARNTGLAAARGELIAFLDQDDLWTPDKLTIQVGYLVQHPEVGYVLGMQRMFLMPGVTKPDWLQPRLLDEPHLGVLTGTLLARKTVFDRIGGFDNRYRNSNDIDWFSRAKNAGIVAAHLPEIVLQKRIHETNESHHIDVSRSERMKVLLSAARRQRGKEKAS